MTGPDYNALQLERNAYNRKVDPYKPPTQIYKPPQIGTELTRLHHGTLKCNNQGLNQKPWAHAILT